MARPPLRASAAVALAAAVGLCLYVWWAQVVAFVLTVLGVRVMWAIGKAKLGIKARPRRKSMAAEWIAAGSAAYLAWHHRPAKRDRSLSKPKLHVLACDAPAPRAASPYNWQSDEIPF